MVAAGKVLVLLLLLLLLPVPLYGFSWLLDFSWFFIFFSRGSVAKADDDERCQVPAWYRMVVQWQFIVSVCVLPRLARVFFTGNLQVYNFFWYNNGDFQAPQKRKVWGPVGPGLYSSCSQVCHLKFCFENLQCSHSQWCDELIANWIYVHIKLITVYINYSIELPWYYAALQVNESQEEE